MHVCNPNLLINIQDYDIDQLLWQKTFITDFLAKDRKHGREVVIKLLIESQSLLDNSIVNECFFRNICHFSEFDFPGIVKILGVRFPLTEDEKRNQPRLIKEFQLPKNKVEKFDFSGFLYVSEYMPYNLQALTNEYFKNWRRSEILNPTVLSKIIFGVAATMKRVHAVNFFHGNLRLDNIYLDENYEPRIADFQVTCFFLLGSSNWNMLPRSIAQCEPPEIFMYGPNFVDYVTYAEKCDVYAYAFLIYSMFTNNLEFDGKKPIRTTFAFMREIERGCRPKHIGLIPEQYWELIRRCWDNNPEDRPSFEEITQLLRSDDFAIRETDLNELHEYWDRIDPVDNH